MKGIFITFEGIDGCGKTTQAELLQSRLQKNGREVTLVREPGGTVISEQIRNILLNRKNKLMSPLTETILLAASRAQLTEEVILPHVDSGHIIISDRYIDSTLAYQGFGRGLSLDWLIKINQFATKGMNPDITVLVDIPVKVAIKRMHGKSFDRMENEGHLFLNRVRDGYLSLAGEYPERYIVVNGKLSRDELSKEIWEFIFPILN